MIKQKKKKKTLGNEETEMYSSLHPTQLLLGNNYHPTGSKK
jgi:hypothetical protein